jgi:group I intron endonuclease
MNLSIIPFLIKMLIIILIFSAYNFHYCTATMEFVFSIFVPIMIYPDAELCKYQILKDGKGKTGIYQWEHKKSNKIYIGSAFDLPNRLKRYFTLSWLKQADNYISRALLLHGHSQFSLTIFEYIDIDNLSSEQARKKILEREQFYLDLIFEEDEPNTYNILKVAGSSQGYKHNSEALAKMSEARKGSCHSAETKQKMSEAKKGNSSHFLGKTHSVESLEKISASRGTAIFVYDTNGTLINTFSSARQAEKVFNSSKDTILKYARNGQLFQGKWKLSTSLINKD